MMRKYGVFMSLPDGKLPGFYAQIVKALAGKTQLFDRDKDLLITSTDEERQQVVEVLRGLKLEYDEVELVLLPSDSEVTDRFDDFGVITRLNHVLVYSDLVSLFRFADSGSDEAEPAQALQQMEEHLLARCVIDGTAVYAVESHLSELIERIAIAYKCKVELIEG
jgi:hypothetical protein